MWEFISADKANQKPNIAVINVPMYCVKKNTAINGENSINRMIIVYGKCPIPINKPFFNVFFNVFSKVLCKTKAYIIVMVNNSNVIIITVLQNVVNALSPIRLHAYKSIIGIMQAAR